MKQIENTLQDLKCMLIEDGYTEANIVLRTLIKAQEQVKKYSIPDVIGRLQSLDRFDVGSWPEGWPSVDKEIDGEWVRWDDIEELIKVLQKDNAL